MISRLVAKIGNHLTALRSPGKVAAVASRYPVLDRFSRRYFAPGLPEALADDELSTICTTTFGSAPADVSHQPISGWKESGAYRLFVHLDNGQRQSLIFKNDVFEPGRNPALDALPLLPGPPEYSIYQATEGPLAPYLPAVYLCDEVRPGRHYRYVLGDLRYDHRRGSGSPDALRIARALPALHRALRAQWPPTADASRLLNYRDDGGEPLLSYAQQRLHRYAADTDDEVVPRLLKEWAAVERVYLDDQFDVPAALTPIHGDLNPSNVHFHHTDDRLTIVDWEWAGRHLMHADLASALRGVSPDDEQRAWAEFAAQNDTLPTNVHAALYQYCKLERGLIDAAFVAGIHRSSATRAQFDLGGYIRGAAGRSLRALHTLTE